MKTKNYKSLIISTAVILLEAIVLYVLCVKTVSIDPMTIPFIATVFLLPISTFVLSSYIGVTKPIMLIPFAVVSFATQTLMPCVLWKESVPWESLMGILILYVLLPVLAGALMGYIIKVLSKKSKKFRPNAKINRL